MDDFELNPRLWCNEHYTQPFSERVERQSRSEQSGLMHKSVVYERMAKSLRRRQRVRCFSGLWNVHGSETRLILSDLAGGRQHQF